MAPPTREDIQRIVDRIVEGYKPEKVILFGSLAWGEAQEESDVDLLVVKETADEAFDREVLVRNLIVRAQGTTPVDVMVVTPSELGTRTEMGDLFIRKVLRQGETLYAA